MAWTADKVEIAKSLWLEGWSAPAIASQLGRGFSRNAVIGKMHRLGLARKHKQTPKPPKPAKRPTAKPLLMFPKRNRVLPPERLYDPGNVDLPKPKHLSLFEISDQQCHYPTKHGKYCGHPVQEGKPYCEGHCKIVYMPTRRMP